MFVSVVKGGWAVGTGSVNVSEAGTSRGHVHGTSRLPPAASSESQKLEVIIAGMPDGDQLEREMESFFLALLTYDNLELPVSLKHFARTDWLPPPATWFVPRPLTTPHPGLDNSFQLARISVTAQIHRRKGQGQPADVLLNAAFEGGLVTARKANTRTVQDYLAGQSVAPAHNKTSGRAGFCLPQVAIGGTVEGNASGEAYFSGKAIKNGETFIPTLSKTSVKELVALWQRKVSKTFKVPQGYSCFFTGGIVPTSTGPGKRKKCAMPSGEKAVCGYMQVELLNSAGKALDTKPLVRHLDATTITSTSQPSAPLLPAATSARFRVRYPVSELDPKAQDWTTYVDLTDNGTNSIWATRTVAMMRHVATLALRLATTGEMFSAEDYLEHLKHVKETRAEKAGKKAEKHGEKQGKGTKGKKGSKGEMATKEKSGREGSSKVIEVSSDEEEVKEEVSKEIVLSSAEEEADEVGDEEMELDKEWGW
ncbi:hypothetical protein JCM11251_000026 [Rhodosporidiobolus azoricus]